MTMIDPAAAPKPTHPPPAAPRILLTGATGYVGGRLLHALEQRGRAVRCLARRPEHLSHRATKSTELVAGDVMKPQTLEPALSGCETAYYLIHSMGRAGQFQQAERQGAENFLKAAEAAGVKRIVYLGGLGREPKNDQEPPLSPHLRSRQEVGRILRSGTGVVGLELRSSIIIGSGSLSFEMIRHLVERLPVMITPRWTKTRTQPIAVEDVVDYLLAAENAPLDNSAVIQIGGADRTTYEDLMLEFAHQRGIKRWIVPVPVLTPRLSSFWLALVTPLQARVGRQLIDSVRNETIVETDTAQRLFPQLQPRGYAQAIQRAMINEDAEFARTRWSDALSSVGVRPPLTGVRYGSRLLDSRTTRVPYPPSVAFEPIRRLGGKNGYYYGQWLWSLRGLMDRFVGGVGLRRGRRHPSQLGPGDPVDFWRVEAFEPDRLLRLRAEMKLPGRAWLQFEVEPLEDEQGSLIRQTAIFDPLGLFGLAYWYSVAPLHHFVFGGMLRGIAQAAEQYQSTDQASVEPLSTGSSLGS
jgi:uncharacterized protein YbjT (DUF2867 family)